MCLKDEKHCIFVFRNMYCWHPPAWNSTVFYSWLMSSRDFMVGLWGSHHSADSATQTNSLGFSFGLCWLSLDWWIPTCVFQIWSESKLQLLSSFREAPAIRQHSVRTPSNRDTVEMCCYLFNINLTSDPRPPTIFCCFYWLEGFCSLDLLVLSFLRNICYAITPLLH